MEFMGIAVGILALVCTAVLLFGAGGTRKILAWLAVLAALGIGGTVGYIIWQEQPTKSIRAQSADGVIHEFPAGTSTDVIDRVMKDYATTHVKPAATPNVFDQFDAPPNVGTKRLLPRGAAIPPGCAWNTLTAA